MRPLRPLLLALVVTVVASASVAAAASLTTTSGSLASSDSAVSACGNTSGIATAYTVAAGKVTEITFTGIPASCDGGTLTATLTNGGVAVGTAGPATVPNNGVGSVKLAVTGQPSSSSVSDTRVQIAGP